MLLRNLEKINQEVKQEMEKEEFERISKIVWNNGKEERKKWILNHKKNKPKINRKIGMFIGMANEYCDYSFSN